MEPVLTGEKYDKIAQWWNDRHINSGYGVKQLEKAVGFASSGGAALDVGCGSGGRFVRLLQSSGFKITGLDVSQEMIWLASSNHPGETFIHRDIATWETTERFNFIVAWDSIFHLPLELQRPVLTKLCELLERDGVLVYTFGDGSGGGTSEWRGETFYHSTIGITENLQILQENGLSLLHLELDQFPEKHVYVIAIKHLR